LALERHTYRRTVQYRLTKLHADTPHMRTYTDPSIHARKKPTKPLGKLRKCVVLRGVRVRIAGRAWEVCRLHRAVSKFGRASLAFPFPGLGKGRCFKGRL
jgi:hypothetical protein